MSMDDLYNNLKVYEPEVKGMSSLSSSTPMETQKPLLKDEDGEEVDVHMYRSNDLFPLMYLPLPDLTSCCMCACARYQSNQNFTLQFDYDGASLDRKSTTGGCQFLGCRLISWQFILNTDGIINIVIVEKIAMACIFLVFGLTFVGIKRLLDDLRVTCAKVPQPSDPTNIVADEAVHKELGNSLVRVATTASSLEAEQDSGNITKTRSKATPNEVGSLGTTLGGGPRCQETMGDTIAQTRFENVSTQFYDPLLTRGNTLRSGKDSLKLTELMELCTTLQSRVLDLEKTKTTQAN
ncbi:hypothetical protein Tco_1182042, partial [Tanacetum coccineum]